MVRAQREYLPHRPVRRGRIDPFRRQARPGIAGGVLRGSRGKRIQAVQRPEIQDEGDLKISKYAPALRPAMRKNLQRGGITLSRLYSSQRARALIKTNATKMIVTAAAMSMSLRSCALRRCSCSASVFCRRRSCSHSCWLRA